MEAALQNLHAVVTDHIVELIRRSTGKRATPQTPVLSSALLDASDVIELLMHVELDFGVQFAPTELHVGTVEVPALLAEAVVDRLVEQCVHVAVDPRDAQQRLEALKLGLNREPSPSAPRHRRLAPPAPSGPSHGLE